MADVLVKKTCRKCGISKDISEFYKSKSNSDGLSGKCKDCYNSHYREKYKNDPEFRKRHLAKGASHRKSDPKRYLSNIRAWRLKTKYGITEEQFNDLLLAQEGKCALCRGDDHKSPTRNGNGTWVVDHDHVTGKVRGLLCNDCNISLGHFEKLTKQVNQSRISEYLLKGQ